MPANIDILINGKDLTGSAVNSAKSGLASLSNSIDATHNKMGVMTVAVGTAIGNLATAGIAKMAEMASSIVTTGVNFNNMKQQAQIAFTTMLGDGGKAKVFLDDLQKFAASTPFEFPELVSASQKMIAMGFAAQDVKPMLTAVGDAVAGLGGGGEMVGRVTTALGQMQAKGKVSAEEMMQLTEAGIPAWQMLADKIGVSVPEAMDMVSGSSKKAASDSGVAWQVMGDGVIQVLPKMKAVASGTKEAGITAADAISAITEGMKKDFGGMMEAQSKTFGGLFSTIKDTFAQVSGQVMGPFFEKMTTGLQVIVDWTSSPAFTGGVADLTKWLQMAADAASVFFGDMMAGQSVIEAATHALRILLPPSIFLVWEDFAGAISWVMEKFSGLMDVVLGRSDALTYFSDLWTEVWGAVRGVFAGITTYVQDNLPQWVNNLSAWATAAWQWVVDAAPQVLAALGTWLGGVIKWLGERLPDFIATVYKWATALVDWIAEAAPRAIQSLTSFVRGLRGEGDNAGEQFGGMVGKWAKTLWRWIVDDLMPKVGPAFGDFARAMLGYGLNMTLSLGELAVEMGRTLWRWIVEVTPVALDHLKTWGRNLIDWVKESLPGWMTQLRKWGVAIWDWIKEAIPETASKIEEWYTKIVDWISKLREQVQTKMDWIRDNVIDPVVEFIKSTKDDILAWKDWLIEKYEYLKTEIPKKMEWIRDNVIEPVKQFIEETKTKIIIWYDWFIEKFTAINDWMKENFDPSDWKKTGENIINALKDGIEIAWIRLSDWFFSDTAFGRFVGDIMEMLGVQLGPAYGVLYENGKKITYSLNDGSRYGLEALRQTGSDMGSAISSGLQTNMDMHSPSRVMWGFGQDIMAGLSGGVREGIGGLKSEMQYVADTIKATMQRANDEMLASIEYFTNQALVKAQTAHYKIANAAVDATAILKQLGIDASKAVGVIGGSAGGTLLLGEGINNLPKQTNPTMGNIGSSAGGNFVPINKEIKTLGESLGTDTIKAQAAAESISLLGGLTLKTVDLAQAKDNVTKAVEQSAKTMQDYVAGIGDFLSGTLTGANSVFGYFKYQEEKAYKEGKLPEYIGSETARTKTQLKGLYQGLQNSIADILGISTSELNVTGGDSKRLIDRIGQLTSGTNAETNIDFIGQLLQSAVDFRNLSNYGTGAEYYKNVLPTDSRLTGGSTVNEFNITLQGSNNANADVMGLVQLLGSLTGTASP